MKILVVGAAGRTGRAVVKQAVAAGHQVTAFVHKTEKFDNADVRVIEGDATDVATIEAAIRGQDVVIDTIGGKTPYKMTTLESSAAEAIIKAMQQNGVRRLMVTSSLGEGESIANATLFLRLLILTFLRGSTRDKTTMVAAVKASSLDWTVLRPAVLSDDPATGNIRVFDAETGEKAHKITRADLAAFIVAQILDNKYLHRAVTVANS